MFLPVWNILIKFSIPIPLQHSMKTTIVSPLLIGKNIEINVPFSDQFLKTLGPSLLPMLPPSRTKMNANRRPSPDC